MAKNCPYEDPREKAAWALLNGATKKEAAQIAGVTTTTIYNWMANDEVFRKTEQRIANAKLLEFRGKTIEVYVELLEAAHPKYRLEAANKINELLGWYTPEIDENNVPKLKLEIDFGDDADDENGN